MLATDVLAQFPPSVAMPAPIRALCDYVDKYDYPLSGAFEISTWGRDDIASWFPGDLAMQQHFAVFGRGSTGSTYALWLRDNIDSNQAPMVVLGSEGDHKVLAVNSLEFCRLLGCGYNELEWDDLTQASPTANETERLRKWLKQRLDVTCPVVGSDIIEKGAATYPDFAEVVLTWQDDHL